MSEALRRSPSRLGSRWLAAIVVACGSALAIACNAPTDETGEEAERRPNLLVIVADDLGYTDLGVYGGEIGTPNLDRLAQGGLLFTQFYAAATCSPTRAMLLSGVDNHLAGLGTMTGDHVGDQLGKPGYETYLNFRVASLAEVLRDAGYRTYMTGKWHLGLEEHTGPAARGFERSFALLQGGAGHLGALPLFSADSPPVFREDGAVVELPDDFYSTRFYAEKLIDYLVEDRGDERPFLAYLAFTAPHWPLQAPEESIARYRGRYDAGYDALLAERLERMKARGLIGPHVQPAPRLPGEPAWDELDDEQKRVEARKMEIYAAMVHDLDTYAGRVVGLLERIGELDDTLILFLSDNGAEGHDLQETWPALRDHIAACCDNSIENMGSGDSYVDYGPNWARAGVGPFRMYKAFADEGGIRVPAIASFPGRIPGGRVSGAFATVKDVMPTLLELAGVMHPAPRYRDREVLPIQGRSMWPLLAGAAQDVHGNAFVMGWELFGRRAIREGDWKLTWTTPPHGPAEWELFHLADDPAEQHDLSADHPERRAAMIRLWETYARDNGVVWSDEPMAY